ncbi:MAG: DUF4337 domain-containing protein [Rhodospirillaceae bacterium]
MEAHEAQEHHEHSEHTAHGGEHGTSNKGIAILIAVLAALLALVDSGGKGAQNEQVTRNIEASDTWAFYQAKTIRSTVLRSSATMLEAVVPDGLTPEKKAKVDKTLAEWKDTADRYDSDPKSNEGRKELSERAKRLTLERDHAGYAYHNFEYGAAALQLGIVLASASVITAMPLLAAVAVVLGVTGTLMGVLGWYAPELLHGLFSHNAGSHH